MRTDLRLLALIAILLFPVCLSAQNRFSLKVGGGIAVYGSDDENSGDKIGHSLVTEFTYSVTNWFSAGLNVHMGMCNTGNEHHVSETGASLRGLFRPFPKKFRFLELGVGLTGMYRVYNTNYNVYEQEHLTCYYNGNRSYGAVGIDFPVRLYAIDSQRFQLMFYYDFKTLFNSGVYYLSNSNGGAMFGIKF